MCIGGRTAYKVSMGPRVASFPGSPEEDFKKSWHQSTKNKGTLATTAAVKPVLNGHTIVLIIGPLHSGLYRGGL